MFYVVQIRHTVKLGVGTGPSWGSTNVSAHLLLDGGTTVEVIIPRPITPTFSYTKETRPRSVGPSFRCMCGRGVSWWGVVGRGLVGGAVDMRKIRVLRLRGVVWVCVSQEGLGGRVPGRGWGGVVA